MNGKRHVRYNRRFSPQRNYRHNQIPKEPPPEKPSKKLFWTLGIIFIIVVGGVASLFLFFSGEETEESSLSDMGPGIESPGIFCEEDWSCTDWSDCVGGNKTRTCSDLNNCGTEENKSSEQQSCEEETDYEDCGSSDACFSDYVETCTPAKATISDQGITYIETIEGYEGNDCILTLVYTESILLPDLVGKEMTCKIPESNLTNFKDYLQGERMIQSCEGPLIDLLIQLSEAQAQTIACGSWDCFIFYASENCDLTSYTNTITINLFGLDITTTTYYEINGKQNNNCIFKIRTEEQHVNYTDELIQQLLDGGATQEEIDQQEQESNIMSDLLEGREGVCEFINNNLITLLTKFKNGNFEGSVSCNLLSGNWDCTYSGDWELAESCEGEYFSSEL